MSWLPRLFEGPEICARITAAGAAATGLAAGTPVAAGAGDQGAGAVGMGILAPGSVSATIGTSGVVFAATATPTSRTPRAASTPSATPLPGVWHVMGVTNGAGLSLPLPPRHLRRQALLRRARRPRRRPSPPASDGLLWAPYLFGERTPHLDPNARAAFVGITASTTHAHFVRAVLEGVAFSLKDTFTLFAELGIPAEQHPPRRRRRAQPALAQIQADVYGQPVELLEAEEGGAFGAALLAGTGIGAWPTVEAACEATIRVAETIPPKNAEIMAAQYRHFRALYPALRTVFRA